jgi:hypothetical protein
MPVQVWIGEKPEHPQERRAIVALAQALERLDGLFLILANFSVGGRAVDMVIVKQDAIVIIELKHVDGRVFGSVNGTWTVVGSNGEEKKLNPGRKNPYNQVISYFHALTNYLNEHRNSFLSEHKAGSMDFRTCKRVVVIAPHIQEGSQIELDWKVELRGLDELPTYLITERSSEIELSEQEMLAIPRLLNCEPWQEVAAVLAAAQPPAAAPAPPAALSPSAGGQPATARPPLEGRALWFAMLAGVPALIGLVWLLLQPGRLLPAEPLLLPALPPAAESAVTAATETPPCAWNGIQLAARRWDAASQTWQSVAAGSAASGIGADLVVALTAVNACQPQLALSWNVQNNSADDLRLNLSADTLQVSDGFGNRYPFDDRDLPGAVTVAAGGQLTLTTVAVSGPALQSGTLRVVLRGQPFGEASFLVALD